MIVEINSTATVTLINNPIDYKHPYSIVIARVHDLLHRDWQVIISYIFHESNRVVDWLANSSHSLNLDVCFYLSSPYGLCDILIDDLVGVSLPQLTT